MIQADAQTPPKESTIQCNRSASSSNFVGTSTRELQPQKCSSHHPKISDMLEDQYTKIIGKQCGAAARIQAPGWRQQRSSSASELSESALPLPVINAQI
ncbi:hypothetical protein ACFX11_037233 [Malus domestica]